MRTDAAVESISVEFLTTEQEIYKNKTRGDLKVSLARAQNSVRYTLKHRSLGPETIRPNIKKKKKKTRTVDYYILRF